MKISMIELILEAFSEFGEKINLGERYNKVSKEEYELYCKLKESLNDAQNAEFEKFSDLILEENCEIENAYFKAGMKAGFRIAVECLTD